MIEVIITLIIFVSLSFAGAMMLRYLDGPKSPIMTLEMANDLCAMASSYYQVGDQVNAELMSYVLKMYPTLRDDWDLPWDDYK